MIIYFEDGRLLDANRLPFQKFFKVDAAEGYSKCEKTFNELLRCTPQSTVYTNSLVALNNQYAWNESLQTPEIYIRAGKHRVFTRIDKLTTRELREGHNIMKMYMANEFGNLC